MDVISFPGRITGLSLAEPWVKLSYNHHHICMYIFGVLMDCDAELLTFFSDRYVTGTMLAGQLRCALLDRAGRISASVEENTRKRSPT